MPQFRHLKCMFPGLLPLLLPLAQDLVHLGQLVHDALPVFSLPKPHPILNITTKLSVSNLE